MIEQRKARRFDLKLPYELVRNGSQRITVNGHTKNISSIGVLLAADAKAQAGDPVEYIITLPTGVDSCRVRIRCLGKIVRVGEDEIAATLERYEFLRESTAGD